MLKSQFTHLDSLGTARARHFCKVKARNLPAADYLTKG
ncbi:hypothetical protein GAGA_0827 [Paraglaciecola agarilytica NO2]|uniref:Uncharacterized protein n=1 Tax=Paraglaciecola agarilytica NO2 TaxID=1125747 RepID=A0ABQ0I2X9_9ALTE|nr:hypothetical protein GAGA_0827 [Paraglaciecola agarilytica NO2]